jgi:hypothetical protein
MAYEETGRDTREANGLPSIRKRITILTPAQQTTLFTVPVSLVPAPGAGKTCIATQIHIRKEAGTIWTTAGSGVLQVSYSLSPTSRQFGLFDQATTTAFFGAAAATWIGEAGKGQFGGLGDTTGTNLIDNSGIVLRLDTANISGGTGNLICTIFYRVWGITRP